MERLRGYLAEAGRDPNTFGIEAQVSFAGGPETWERDAEGWKSLGANFIALRTMDAGLATPADHLRAIEQYAREAGVER